MTILKQTISSPVEFTLTEFLESEGLIIESGSDFEKYKNALKAQPDKDPIGPRFRPESFQNSDDEAFWVIGKNDAGQIVHTQAMRHIDLKGQSLGEHFEARIDDYISEIFDHDRMKYQAGPGAKTVTGKVCYVGEFWMQGGEKGIRGSDLATPLSHLTMAMCLLRWSPDYIFAIMRSSVICKGLAARSNFLRTEPGSFTLPFVDQGEDVEAWTAWSSREDMQYLMKLALSRRKSNFNNKNAVRQKWKVA